jgi:hypothetical protein
VLERNTDIRERQRPVTLRNEFLARRAGKHMQDPVIEHVPGTDLLLDHVETGLFYIHCAH